MGRFHVILITLILSVCADVMAAEPFNVSSTVYPSYSQPEVIPGKGNGVLYDITVEAFKAADSEVNIHFIPMVRIVWSVIEKKDHATLGVINWFIKEKKEHLVQPVDLIKGNIVFFYKKEQFPMGISFDQLSELKKYRIGSLYGSSTLPLFEKAGIKPELVAELEQNFKKLDAGRIDLTVAIDLTGWIIIKKLFPGSVKQFATVKKPLLPLVTSITFLREENALNIFKSGLDIIVENGTFYDIVSRYYGDSVDYADIVPHDIFVRMKKKLL